MKNGYENCTQAAESVAIQALTFIASEPAELERFLALTGLDHGSIRSAAAEPGFLVGVLDHLTSHEPLLVAFASHADLAPAEVERARAALSGQRWQRESA